MFRRQPRLIFAIVDTSLVLLGLHEEFGEQEQRILIADVKGPSHVVEQAALCYEPRRSKRISNLQSGELITLVSRLII